MIIEEEITIPERKQIDTKAIICDCCKKEYTGDMVSKYKGEVEWPIHERGSYHHTETHVCLQETASYPDDVTWEALSFDICPDCMKAVVFPFLQEKCGIPPHKEDDW